MAQNRIDFTVGAKVDQNSFNQVKKAFDELNKQMATKSLDKNSLISKETIQSAEQFQDIMLNAMDSTGKINFNKLADGLKQSGKTLQDFQMDLRKVGNAGDTAFNQSATAIMKQTKQIKQSNKFLDEMFNSFKNIATYQINTRIFNSLLSGVQNAISFTKELDKNLTDIQIVTNKSSDSMRQFAKEANAAAKELSISTNEYASASLIYYEQGLNDSQVKNRTNITAKVANVTGQTAQQVSEEVTAVWNGYQVAEDEAEAYIDKMAKVAASSASNLSELSGAISKVASAAKASGVSMDQLTAQISTIESVTRQAPESIGTALKTIYARIGDLKVDGVDEFGTKLGEVSSTMKQMGINVTDEAGNMREMGTIIEEVASKWEGWTGAQKQAAAVAMAGKRQYNNLMALFENWDQYESMKGIAENSEGTLEQQQRIFEDSVEGREKKLKASMEGIYQDLFSADALEGTNTVLTEIADTFDRFIKSLGGGGQALLTFGGILVKVFNKQIAQRLVDFRKNIEIKKNNQQQAAMQLTAANAILNNPTQNISTPEDAYKAKEAEIQAKYTKELLVLSQNLSAEEFEELKGMKDQTAELEAQLALKEKIKEEKTITADQSGIKGGISKDIKDLKNGDIEAEDRINTKISKTRKYTSAQIDRINSIGTDTETFNVTTSEYATAKEQKAQEKINNLLQERARIKKQLDKLEADNKKDTKEYKDQQKALRKVNNELKEEQKNAKAVFEVRNKKLDTTEQDTQEIRLLNEEIEETKSKAQQAKQGLDGAFSVSEKANSFTNNIQDISNAFMALTTVISGVKAIKDIWTDDDLSTWDKVTQTAEQLLMIFPMLATSVVPLIENIAKANAAKLGMVATSKKEIASMIIEKATSEGLAAAANKEQLAEAAKLIAKNKNITASEIAAATGMEEAAAQALLTTATEGATGATISFNAALMANPIVLVVTAIIALIGVVIALAKAEEEEREEKKEAIKQTNENITKTNEEIKSKRDLIQSLKDLNEQYKKTGEGADELKKKAQEVIEKWPDIKNGQLLLESGNYDEILRQGRLYEIADAKETVEKNKEARKQIIDWSAASTGVDGVDYAYKHLATNYGQGYRNEEEAQKAANKMMGNGTVYKDGEYYKVKGNNQVITYEDVEGGGYGSGTGTGDIKFFKEYDKKMQQLADQYGLNVEDFYKRVGGNKEGESAYLSIDETVLKRNEQMYAEYQKLTQEIVDKYNDTGENEIEVATAMRKALEGQKDAVEVYQKTGEGMLDAQAIVSGTELDFEKNAKDYADFASLREKLRDELKKTNSTASDEELDAAVGDYITSLNNNILNSYEQAYAKQQTIPSNDDLMKKLRKSTEKDNKITSDELAEKAGKLYGVLQDRGLKDFDLGNITEEQWKKFYSIENEKKAQDYIIKEAREYQEKNNKALVKSTLESSDFKQINSEMQKLYNEGKFNIENLKGLKEWDALVQRLGGDSEKAREKIRKFYEEQPDSQINQINEFGKGIKAVRDVLQAKAKNPNQGVDADILGNIPDEMKKTGKAYEDFIRIAGDSKSSMEQVQNAADNMTTAYFNSSSYLETLTDQNESWIASQLKAKGIANADEVARQLKIKSMAQEDKNLKSLLEDKKLDNKESQKAIDLYSKKSKLEKAAAAYNLFKNSDLSSENDGLKETVTSLEKVLTAYKLDGKVQEELNKIKIISNKIDETKVKLNKAIALSAKYKSRQEIEANALKNDKEVRAEVQYKIKQGFSQEDAEREALSHYMYRARGAEEDNKEAIETIQEVTNLKIKLHQYDTQLSTYNKKIQKKLNKVSTVKIKTDPGDNNNNNSGSKSGSQTKQPKKLEKITEEIEDYNDAYRKVNEEIEKLQRNLDIAANKSEKLTGKQKQASLQKQINLLGKINKQEMRRVDIADKQVEAAKKKLSKKTKGKKNEGHTYETWNFKGVDLSDADSVERERSKLESATKNIKTKYNNAIGNKKTKGTYAYDVAQFEKKWGNKELNKKDSKYKARKNALAKLESKKYNGYTYSKLKEMKKEYDAKAKRQENFESIVKDSDEARAILEEAKENIRQNLYTIIEAQVEKVKIEFDIKLEVNQAKRSLKELRKSFDELNGASISKLMQDDLDLAKLEQEDLNTNIAELDKLSKQASSLYNASKGDISVVDQAALKADLQETYDKIIENGGNIAEYYRSAQEQTTAAVTEWGDAVSKVLDFYKGISEALEWQIELTKLIKGESNPKSYKEINDYYDKQLNNTKSQYDFIKVQITEAKKMAEDISLPQATRDAARDLWKDYLSQGNEALTKIAELAKEKTSEILKQAADISFRQATGSDRSLENLKADWEDATKWASKYKDPAEKNFEINERIAKLKQDVDGMSDVYAAQKLNSEMQKEIKHLQDIGKLTQAELDRYDKIYQVKLAQIALENAQNNKNTMRLRRDSQGNYSYVFQADAAEIEKAKEALEKAKYDLYEQEKENISSSVDEYFSAFGDIAAEVQRMAEAGPDEYTENDIQKYIENRTSDLELAQHKILESINHFTDDQKEVFAEAMEITTDEWNQLSPDEQIEKLAEHSSIFGEEMQKNLAFISNINKEGYKGLEKSLSTYNISVVSAVDKQKKELENINSKLQNQIDANKTFYDVTYEQGLKNKVGDKIADITATENAYKNIKDIYIMIDDLLNGKAERNEDGTIRNGTERNTKGALSTMFSSLETAIGKINKDKDTNSKNNNGGEVSGDPEADKNSKDRVNSQLVSGYNNVTLGDMIKTVNVNRIRSWFDSKNGSKYVGTKSKKKDITKYSAVNQLIYSRRKEIIKSEDGFKAFAKAIGVTYNGTGKNSNLYKTLIASGFRTGGYTGDWPGLDGKFALLHQKELVLNATDTKNILAAVQELRNLNLDYLASNIKTKASNILSGMLSEFATAQSTLASSLQAAGSDSQVLDQNVHIEASFPNVKDAREVEAALNNLTSRASQYIHSSEKMR